MNNHEHRFAALYLEHLHDARVVWAFEVQGQTALAGDRRELGSHFLKYLFQVPANRIGSARRLHDHRVAVFRQMPRWNNIVSFLLIVAAVYFTFNFEK
jgi:hypothetical protein